MIDVWFFWHIKKLQKKNIFRLHLLNNLVKTKKTGNKSAHSYAQNWNNEVTQVMYKHILFTTAKK